MGQRCGEVMDGTERRRGEDGTERRRGEDGTERRRGDDGTERRMLLSLANSSTVKCMQDHCKALQRRMQDHYNDALQRRARGDQQ